MSEKHIFDRVSRRRFLKSFAAATATVAFLGVSRLVPQDGPGWEEDEAEEYRWIIMNSTIAPNEFRGGWTPVSGYERTQPIPVEIGRYDGIQFAPRGQ